MPEAHGFEVDLSQMIARRQVVVVVGSGVSCATNRSSPSWRGLIESGVKLCRRLGATDTWAEMVLSQLNEQLEPDLLLSAAGLVHERLQRGGGGDFRGWLRAEFESLKPEHPGLIQAINKLNLPILTTNYDDLIQKVTGLKYTTWTESAKVARAARGDDRLVIHLHGHWDEPSSVVLGIRSYEYVKGDPHTQAVMRALALTRSLLFIGCGEEGLADPNFGNFLSWLQAIEVDAGVEHRHYRLVREQDNFEPRGRLFPLVYGKEYGDLQTFLERLIPTSEKVEEPVADPEPPVSWLRPTENFSDPTLYRVQELEFLDAVEQVVKTELHRSGDEHFVELSMQLGIAPLTMAPQLHSNFRLALVVPNRDSIRPEVENREELFAKLRKHRGLVLLAPPGAGKTTILQHLTLHLIGEYRRQNSPMLPMFVPLVEYGLEDRRPLPITKFLESYAARLVGPAHHVAKKFESIAKSGRFVFILDGLDQMANRRSETVRMEHRGKIERKLRRLKWLSRLAGFFRKPEVDAMLAESERSLEKELEPEIDAREREISRLTDLYPSLAIASCRVHDFVGAPNWVRFEVLPMTEDQVRDFVTGSAPQALAIIEEQLAARDATRSLVTNPFYLRLLTRAVQDSIDGGMTPEQLEKAIQRRGRLLFELIFSGIRRSTGTDRDAYKAMDKLGALAHYMLERNIIGSVFEDSLRDQLGPDYIQVMRHAQNTNLVECRDAPVSMQFNHQLFLEVLLAYHLERRSRDKGGFEEGLELLALRGDRWAETVKLLFEMAEPARRNALSDACIDALSQPSTWDIATRVLSDIGHEAVPRILPLLKHRDELTRRGAVNILGRIRATEATNLVVDLFADPAFRVRIAAVEALIQLGEVGRLVPFERDPSPMVVRTALRGRLLHCESPLKVVREILLGNERSLKEQAVRALLDVLPDVVQRMSAEEVSEAIEGMISNELYSVKVLGYQTAAAAPIAIRRRLKKTLLGGALGSEDSTINYVARQAVFELLDETDLQYLKAESSSADGPLGARSDRQRRAHWLVLEVEQGRGVGDFLKLLVQTSPDDVALLARRMASEGDPAALALLTDMLGDPRTANFAVIALTYRGRTGIDYLLSALYDPASEVRLGAARILAFCHLPSLLRTRVKQEIRNARVTTHELTPIGASAFSPASQGTAWLSSYAVLNLLSTATVTWFTSWLFDWGIPWLHCARYGLMTHSGYFYGGMPLHNNLPYNGMIERRAFSAPFKEPDVEYWLARGHLLREKGRLDEARLALRAGLSLRPQSTAFRLELALVHRRLDDRREAIRVLKEGDEADLEQGTDSRHLLDLLEMEQPGKDLDEERRLDLMIMLRLYQEAFPMIRAALKSKAAAPWRCYCWLYHIYLGTNQTARALAAAIRHRRLSDGEAAISEVEIDNLQWLHRQDQSPADIVGDFELLTDLEEDGLAIDLLRQHRYLPAESDPIAPENEELLIKLSSPVQRRLVDFLQRVDPRRAAEIMIVLGMPKNPVG